MYKNKVFYRCLRQIGTLAVSTRHLSKVLQFLIFGFMHTKELFQCRVRVGGSNAAFQKLGKFFISGFYVRPGDALDPRYGKFKKLSFFLSLRVTVTGRGSLRPA